LIIGAPGSGKTHLASLMVGDKKHISFDFYEFEQRMRKKTGTPIFYDIPFDVEFIIVDEIGY